MKDDANSAITQYSFNADAYFRFVDDVRKLDVDVLIVPGIIPITNFSQLMRFSGKRLAWTCPQFQRAQGMM